MEAQCSHCKYVNKFVVPEKAFGKTIKITCRNKACSRRITLTIPKKVLANSETKITSSTSGNIKSARLDVIPNELTAYAQYNLKEGMQFIGRKSPSVFTEIQIETKDSDISRKHCSINCFQDPLGNLSFTLRDEGSKNGLYLNGMQIQESEEIFLIEGDVIKMGNSSFLFVPQYK